MSGAPIDDDFGTGWLDTEVGRQVQPVVRRRRIRRRLRSWGRALVARFRRRA
jgi:hypothetical protein